MALSFDGTVPQFAPNAKKEEIPEKTLTVYYDRQCPYIVQTLEKLKSHCETADIPADFIEVDTLEKAKNLPCVFNNWAVFYNGKFVTVNLLDPVSLGRLLK